MSGNLIKSDTTFKFKPATFKMKQGIVIRFEHVSNITLEPAGAYRVDITCVGNNSGFIFSNVSGLVVQNMTFDGCVADQTPCNYNTTLCVKESSNVMLKNLTFRDGIGAIVASNVYGNFSIENSLFVHNMQGPAFLLLCDNKSELCSQCYSAGELLTVMISNSQFIDSFWYPGVGVAYAINIIIGEWLPTEIYLENITITNNTHGSSTPGIRITSDSAVLHTIIRGVNYTNNQVIGELVIAFGASDFLYKSNSNGRSSIAIIDSSFVNNNFRRDSSEAVKTLDVDDTLYGALFFRANDGTTSISSTTISNNSGLYGAALLHQLVDGMDGKKVAFLIENSTVSNNSLYVSDYYKKGAVQLNFIGNITVHNCSIMNNLATGFFVQNSNVHFGGDNTIRGNQGYNGGGMALYYGSTLTLLEDATISFEDNLAENNGGGLYVEEYAAIVYVGDSCSVFVQNETSASLHFSNNSAKTAGNDWYGGNLYCTTNVGTFGWQVITNITDFSANYSFDLTSDPLHVCDCSTESNQDCIDVVHTVQTIHRYPGKLFNLSLLAVGQLLNISTLTGVPTAIYAGLLPLHNKSGIIANNMRVQRSERRCSNLTYRVSSSNPNETMVLSVEDNIDKIPEYFLSLWQQNDSQWNEHVKNLFSHHLTVPAYLIIHLQPCPVGFELKENSECDCSSYLTEYVGSCSIDRLSITRKSPIWLSFTNSSQEHFKDDNNIFVYLIHKHCPFDYCLSGDFNFSLEYPDAQCNHNRSGILCGKCKPGYSLTLGTNECKECTNIYLLLLAPFGLAGILLIVFISLTDMTVTAGTVNGLLFFANIVRENQATFFPPQATKGFLSVFIAWLNLDFGISTCLYDGFDAYTFTWLQFSFPMYIWLLAFSIIIASRYFALMNKLCARNIVHVLATLFLLSYTKFQRTIAAALSFTVVDMSNGASYFAWLSDGNAPYLEGKHIPLFLVSALFMLVLFIPYTLSITFGPWLQAKSHYKVFCWVPKLKPLFDAYYGPLRSDHRYWTGVLLLSRLILSLISSVNVLGDDDFNLMSVNFLTFFLLVLLWQSGGVYRYRFALVLDSFFLINLGVLSFVTSHNHKASQVSDSSQYATICVSVGSVFAVFCLILLYHCLKRLGLLAAISKRHPQALSARVPLLEDDDNREVDPDDDVDMLNAIDEGHISDPQIMRTSNTEKVRSPDTY